MTFSFALRVVLTMAVLAFAAPMRLEARQASAVRTAPTKALQNLDFEEGVTGQAPPDWVVPGPVHEAGFRATVAEGKAPSGKRYATLFRESGTSPQFGNLMQAVDAEPFRGKRIKVMAKVRLDSVKPRATAQMWVRVDRAEGRSGFFDNMQNRPVTEAEWRAAEIIGDVDGDASVLNIGMILVGGGTRASIDAVTVEVLGATPVRVIEAARPLDEGGLRNLETFGRALASIRFFHPSDAAANADWDRLAREGVKDLESAASTRDLRERLKAFFALLAPSVQFLTPHEMPKVLKAPVGAAGLMRWIHNGAGLSSSSMYRSQRQKSALAPMQAGWLGPQHGATVDLGGGLKALVPTTLYTSRDGSTLPKSAAGKPVKPESAGPALPKPTAGGERGLANDRATRLANVIQAWGVFKHFYPYFDIVKTDWDSELPKALSAAATDVDEAAFTLTLRRLVAALKDGHGSVSGPDSGTSTPALSLMILDGFPVVSQSMEASVPAGSRILSVDGEQIESRMERLRGEISAASQGWMNDSLARRLLAGPYGKPATLLLLTPGGKKVEATYPRTSNPWQMATLKLPEPHQELRPGIWYLDLARTSDAAFATALPKLASAKGVIFDLRGYPSMGTSFLQHLTSTKLQSASWNVPVVTQPDGARWEWNTSGRWDLAPAEPRITGKVAFLTGGGAISYAESCMGIVEAYKLAEIVGESTAGTNGNVNPFELPGGYRINWTGMKVIKHDGTPHHGVGIKPTIPLKPTIKGLAEGRDEVLEKAIEVVSR